MTNSLKLTARIVGLVLATTAGITFPSGAEAATHTHHDATQDLFQASDDGQASHQEPRPHQRAGDITEVVVQHRARRLIVTLKFRDLPSRGVAAMYTQIVTAQERFEASLYRDEQGKITPFVLDESFNDICTSTTWKYSERLNIVRISLPTRCLGSPRWVRVGAAYSWGIGIGPMYYVDDARRDHGFLESGPVLGPRIRRG